MKRMVIGSLVVTGLVGIAAVVDMVVAVPFSGGASQNRQFLMDGMFLASALLIGYMGYETLRDLAKG